MAWGKRSRHAALVLLLAGAIGAGCLGGSDKKNQDDPAPCAANQQRVCIDDGSGERCSCEPTGVGGSAGSASIITGGGAGLPGTGGGPPGVGGVSGSAGTSGSAGESGSGGVPDSGTPPGSRRFGDRCVSTDDCVSGLVCLAADSSELGGAGPPGGLCTLPCINSTECVRLDLTAVCLNFGPEEAPINYCVQGCSFGPASPSSKCRGRSDFACAPLFGATDLTCTTDANCGQGYLCDLGLCYAVFSGCTPQCNGDADCSAGRFCDPGTGLCSSSPPTGLPNAAACVQPAPGAPDPCRGLCIGLTGTTGTTEATVCAEKCTLGALASCGWSGPTSGVPADGACLFASGLIPNADVGDLGSCARLCNCNDDCGNAALVCVPIGNAQAEQAFRRRGYCTTPSAGAGIVCP